MSREIIFARTAVAALGVVALAPTSAPARGFSGGHASFGHSSFGHSSFQRSFGRGRRSGTSTTPPRSGTTMAMIISACMMLARFNRYSNTLVGGGKRRLLRGTWVRRGASSRPTRRDNA